MSTTTLTTDQRKHVTVVRKWQTRTDASTLTMARSLKALSVTMSSVREVSRVLAAEAVEGEDSIKLSHVTIQRYVNVLDSLPADVDASAFVTAYRDASKSAREAGQKRTTTAKGDSPDQKDAVTPGDSDTLTVASAIAAFDDLLNKAEALPARDRQRFVQHVTRVMARRYAKAA